jgi:hypothetical protein
VTPRQRLHQIGGGVSHQRRRLAHD